MAYTDIDKPSDYFNTVLYTGDDASNRAITGVGFQPDLVWQKSRNTAYNHYLTDAVRGAGYILKSNLTSAEVDGTAAFKSFDTDGFTLTQEAGFEINKSAVTYTTWNWLAGGTAVSNTDGSITSNVSANTTAGFSIVSYTGNGSLGATIGHGLGVAPRFIVVKQRNSTASWVCYHASLGNTKRIFLNLTNASDTDTDWNNTTPTSNVFYVGNSVNNNASGSTYIAYCFADVKGFSKFGSYTGNNSTNGPMIYTGFKPAWLLIKATNAAQWWTLLDSKRDTYNQASLGISPNSSDTESTFNTNRGPHYIDFLSNGFKIRTDNSGVNGTNSFIYAAFAENPFTTSTGIPATAR